MRILLVRLRLIGDVVFTTPLIRALRRRYPDAHLTYLVEPAAAPIVHRQPASQRGDRRAETPRRRASARRPGAGAPAAARALRRRHRPAWRAARRLADLGQRRADAHRLPDRRARRGCTRTSSRAIARPVAAPLGAQPVGPAGAARHRRLRRPRATRWRWRRTRRARRTRRRAASRRPASVGDDPLVVMHVSAGNPFRRWPAGVVRHARSPALAQRDPRRRIIVASGPSDAAAAAARSRTPPARRLARRRTRCRRCSTSDLAELRALVARAAVYIGGDSGPLHVAATTAHADRRAARSDAARALAPVARSALVRRDRWTPARCRAGRAISGTACPGTSAA